MHYDRHVCRVLDDEHRASLALLERLERALARQSDEALGALAQQLLLLIDHEVTRHFAFEEDQLFPRLRDAGDGAIAALLAAEHADLRDLCAELRPLVLARIAGPTGSQRHGKFQRLASELIERMVAHIQKETMGLLPLLEDLLDEAADRELALAYTSAD